MTEKLLLIALLLVAGCAYGQQAIDRAFLGSGFNGFTIPNNPANKVIGVEASDLLMPSPAFFPIAASLVSTSRGTSYSIEGTPFYKSIKERRYSKFDDLSNNFKVSMAYSNNNRHTGAVGIGVRTSITANRSYFYNDVFNIHRREQQDVDSLELEFAKKMRIPLYLIRADSSLLWQMDNYVDQKLKETNFLARRALVSNHWNRLILDLGMALLIAGQHDPILYADSISGTPAVRRFSFWYTGAFPLTRKTQLVGCINYSHSTFRESSSDLTASSFRINHGTNMFKGYAEFGVKGTFKKGATYNILILFGAEFNIFEGIWIDLNSGFMGAATQKQKPEFKSMVSGFTVRITPQQILLDHDNH